MDTRKRKSKDQESRVAKELSGRVTPASGALWGAKADVRNDIFLVECKTTEKDFYSLTFNTWDKVYHEAIKDSLRIPVMCIDILNGKYRYAVMCYKDLPEYNPLYSSVNLSKPSPYVAKSSFRVKDIGLFSLVNSRSNKAYCLVSMNWSSFLNEVVKFYE